MKQGQVGMVGLGQMGFPIALRLLDRCEPLVFHARRADVAAALTNLGATRAKSLKMMAGTCDVVIVCVYDDVQVREVCLGKDGLLAHLSPGSILINHTTCDPNTMRLLDEQAGLTVVGVVDGALSGSPADISEGHLTLWVGGRPDLLQTIDPIIRSYADPVIHVGIVGDGQWVKLVNNALFAGNVALVSAAERVLNQAGLSTVRAIGAIQHGSGDSRALALVSRFGGSDALARVAGRFLRKDVQTVVMVANERQMELGVLGQIAGSIGGEGMTPSMERLWDIEQIKQLKARYFRYLDTKDWDAFETLFTDDCVHYLPQESAKVAMSNEEYFADLKSMLGGGITTHHGHMPEISLLSDTEAEGIWAMFDYVQTELPSGPLSIQGYGHYFETYRKGPDGSWRISSKRNVRLRLDHLPRREEDRR